MDGSDHSLTQNEGNGWCPRFCKDTLRWGQLSLAVANGSHQDSHPTTRFLFGMGLWVMMLGKESCVTDWMGTRVLEQPHGIVSGVGLSAFEQSIKELRWL